MHSPPIFSNNFPCCEGVSILENENQFLDSSHKSTKQSTKLAVLMDKNTMMLNSMSIIPQKNYWNFLHVDECENNCRFLYSDNIVGCHVLKIY